MYRVGRFINIFLTGNNNSMCKKIMEPFRLTKVNFFYLKLISRALNSTF